MLFPNNPISLGPSNWERGSIPSVNTIEGGDFFGKINELLKDCTTILDVGARMGQSISALKAPVKIGLEIHRPYLENWPPMEPSTIPLNLPAKALRTAFMPKSIDAVCFIDSLEHLGPKEARAALADAEAAARRIVVVFTPRGFFPQRNHDAWGLGGEAQQRHRSGWEPEDFTALGYDVLIFPGFHNDENEAFRRAFGAPAPRRSTRCWRIRDCFNKMPFPHPRAPSRGARGTFRSPMKASAFSICSRICKDKNRAS